MIDSDARAKAKALCKEMEQEFGIQWMADSRTGEPVERDTWVEKIAAALLEASRGKP